MRQYEFLPHFDVCREMPGQATIEELAREVSMYSATPSFVRKSVVNHNTYTTFRLSRAGQAYLNSSTAAG